MITKHLLLPLLVCALISLTAIVNAAGDTPAVGTTAPEFQLSVDTAESHKSFCAKEGLNFKLLSDPYASTSAAYSSVMEHNGTTQSARNTFIIDPEGKIANVFAGVKPGGHSEEVLSALAALQTSSKASVGNALGPEVRKYLRVSTDKVILEHVEIIDGTGAAPIPDQNISIAAGKITAISPGADESAIDGTTILNLRGYSVMPGIVGMHNHLFYLAVPNLRPDGSYDRPTVFSQMSFSAPRLYLANGVTTMRTAGSVEPYTDLKLKRAFETGILPGPHLDVTGPYLNGPGTTLQMPDLTGPDDARQTVAFWADRGVTSFKAYKYITREEMRAAVEEAHKRGLKVTGHLCSVTYAEAVEIGIDNLEHGFFVNTEMDPDKKLDRCSASEGDYTLEHMSPGSVEADRLITTLIKHHVAITSTLPGLASTVARETSADGGPPLRPAVLQAMAPSVREAYLYWRNRPRSPQSNAAFLLRRDMDLERAFVAAGGLLLAGADPVGNGGVIPGFGDQREIELLVEAGFAPVQAIRIATLNGAIFLGRQDHIGSIAVGKNADLVVMKGDPATRIADIENVEIVFKDGVGYDSKKLLDSVKGRYGEY
jgi:imidazolonepropionase-like amidohydrolase